MKKNSYLRFKLRILSVVLLSFFIYIKSQAQTSTLVCGPIITLYQTQGINGETHILRFNQFAQSFVYFGKLPGVTNAAAPNSAYNYNTQYVYSNPATTGLTKVLYVFDPANNFAKVGEIEINGTTNFNNTLFAVDDYVGFISSTTFTRFKVTGLTFATPTTRIQIDVTVAPNTQATLNTAPGGNDFSMVGNFVYSVSGTGSGASLVTRINRVNLSTLATDSKVVTPEDNTSSPALSGAWGATWQDIKGNFYAFNNASGEIFRVDNINSNFSNIPLRFYKVFTGTPSGQNDGFGCELVPDLLDYDGDGVNDNTDLDDDNDGITDIVEGYNGYAPDGDYDIDGTFNFRDPDLLNGNFVDVNLDGINDRFDTDLDGYPDAYDLDSDNDGCSDANEAYGSIVDTNGDGTYGGAIDPLPTPADVNANGLVTLAGIIGAGTSYTTTPSTNFRIATRISVTQPTNQIVNNGANISFSAPTTAANTITFSNTGVPNYAIPPATNTTSFITNYQWQEKPKGSSTWTNITNTGIYSNATTPTLTLTGVGVGYDEYEYRIIVTHSSIICNEISIAARLDVNTLLSEISVNGSISESVAGTATLIPDQLAYPLATSVILTPIANPGYLFKGWKVDGTLTTGNPDKTLTVTMNADKLVEALFEPICAWRSVKAGVWGDNTVWEALGCETGWTPSLTPPNNDRPTYVFHEVDITTGNNIVADSLYIETTGRLEVCGTLEIDNEVIFKVDENGKSGQIINNCGANTCTVNVRDNASIIVRKSFVNDSNVYPWSFVSFPFNVDPDSIFVAGTSTKATWGDLTTSSADFFMGEYDGQKRANDGFTNGTNYINVPGHQIIANKGYILAGGDDFESIDFKSAVGTDFLCNTTQVITTYYEGIRGECDLGWNLVGAPFVSGYDLVNASGNKPYYVFDASSQNYTTVMSGDNYLIYPFSSFFVQNLGDSDGVTFTNSSQTFKAIRAAISYDEISLNITNGIHSDKTRIRLQEDALVNFERAKDGIKLMSPVMSVPQIYTDAPGACGGISFNSLPMNTTQVDLKVRTGKSGIYTISLTDKEKLYNVKKVILIDNETKAQTNLVDRSYTYDITNSTTTISSRFYITLSTEEANGLNVIGGTGISVHNIGNKVYLNGLNGQADLRLFDAAGKLIYQFSDVENSVPVTINVPGLYIMDINASGQNARVKLIINN